MAKIYDFKALLNSYEKSPQNRRKRVFTVFGNYDVQMGCQTIRKSACGSECRGFESHRAPSQSPVNR